MKGKNNNMKRLSSRFTLVELLVVIAIISILVALLFPSLKAAKDTAKSIQCLSQLKQVGVWGMIYANDWNNVMPTNGGNAGAPEPQRDYWHWQISSTKWFNKCDYYEQSSWKTLTSKLHCPGARTHSRQIVNEPSNRSFSYALEQLMGGGGEGTDTYDKPKQFPVPKRTKVDPESAWFADASGKYIGDPLPSWCSGAAMYYNSFFQFKFLPMSSGSSQYTPWPIQDEYRLAGSHPGQTFNVVFVSGHAQSINRFDERLR